VSGTLVQTELVRGGMVPPHAEEWWQNTGLFVNFLNQVLLFLGIVFNVAFLYLLSNCF